jgi:hypothetical protein
VSSNSEETWRRREGGGGEETVAEERGGGGARVVRAVARWWIRADGCVHGSRLGFGGGGFSAGGLEEVERGRW